MQQHFEMIISVIVLIVSLFVVLVGIVTFVYNLKLYFYLKKTNIERWEELTTIDKFGPGLSNPSRWIPYLYNDVDENDRRILFYKKKIRFLLFCFLAGLLFIFIIPIILFLVTKLIL